MFVQDRETPLEPATWTFEAGRLTKYDFPAKEEEFLRIYPNLPEGKDRPGLLSIGLNPRISAIPVLLDQERGTVDLAIGRNSFFGGKTRLHGSRPTRPYAEPRSPWTERPWSIKGG